MTDSALPTLLSTSLPHAGKFEDFKVLGALLELDIGNCAKIDCKNALEVLRAKHGRYSVKLDDCGKFTLAEDLPDIKDITSIDLSRISSLEGT